MLIESDPVLTSSGCAVKRPLRDVNFFCLAPQARSVVLVGDFNDWNPAANPMQRLPDGGWWLRMTLPHGYHQYSFLVDEKPLLDPRALGTVRNERGDLVSLMAVS